MTYIAGRVATDDGTLLPSNVIVERVCNANIRQQVYATSHGDFTMDLGGVNVVMDASGGGDFNRNPQQNNGMPGVPRRTLENCEMRASASGFLSKSVDLMALTPSESRVDVGAIVVHRTEKINGNAVSASLYKAPKDAVRAYEKGEAALKSGKNAEARQFFEEAVKVYPSFTNAWFELGNILRKTEEKPAAQAAYLRATTIDSNFLPAHLAMASMAFEERKWPDVLDLTRYILSREPLDYSKVSGYVLDLDKLDYAEAYFYNAAANFNLNRMDEAEKSGMHAERLDLRPRFPQLRLLMAEIFVRKNEYPAAVDQLQMYLTIAPTGKNADSAREELAKLEKMSGAGPASEQSSPN